jgi:hypothetical protein
MFTNQKVSRATKDTPQWRKDTIQWIISKGYNSTRGQRRSYQAKKANYDLLNSILNEDDFNYVTKPFGVDLQAEIGQLPANFQNYNLIVPYFNLIVGEELQRPFNYKAFAEAGEGFNKYQEDYKEALTNAYLSKLKAALGDKVDEVDPAEIEKYFTSSYTNNFETVANKLLSFSEKDLRLQDKFNKGFQHGLASAEEVYFVGIYNNEPIVEVCNPLNLEFNKNQDCEFIQDGDWVYWRRWLDRGQVFEYFGDKLSKKDKELLNKDDIMNPTPSYQALPGIFTDYPNTVSGYNQANKVAVTTVAWKSYTECYIVNFPDRFGELQTELVFEEGFKLSEEQVALGYTVTKEWLPEAWIGHRIGNEIFIAEPSPYQFRSIDNPWKCKLPFVGGVYNNLNSMPTSLVDFIKPYQMLYNIIWYRLELEFSRASGKKLIMDLAQMPKSKGISTEQWMYYLNTLGIAFINSMEEGEEGTSSQGKTSNWNGFTGIDMSLSNTISGYFEMLAKIEQCVQTITGITPQRMGQVKSTETVGGVERSISQSNAVTELYFYQHSQIKQQVLIQLLEVSKIAYRDSQRAKLIFDDFTRELLDLSILSNTDYGIFVSDATKDNNTLQALKSVAKEGISSGTLEFSNLITLVASNSVAEVKRDIKESEKKAFELKKGEQQNQQAQIESQERIAKEQMDRQDANLQLDRENKLQVATINATRAKDGITDNNGDGIIDQLQVAQLGLEQSRESFKQKVDSNKLSLEMKKMELDQANFEREQNQQDQKNKQDAAFKAEELKLKKEKLEIDRKALKYKKTPNTPKKK